MAQRSLWKRGSCELSSVSQQSGWGWVGGHAEQEPWHLPERMEYSGRGGISAGLRPTERGIQVAVAFGSEWLAGG